MKFDIVLAGVGGQGVLSLSGIIAAGAIEAGLYVKQSEVHGMAQRGGAVTAHLRLSDTPVESELVPWGCASMILSLEPLESLRYLHLLSPSGTVVTASHALANMPAYPPGDVVLDAIRSLPRAWIIDATSLARRSGLAQATNMVMAGAASVLLPVAAEAIESRLAAKFSSKGRRVVDANLLAFRAGREEVACLVTR